LKVDKDEDIKSEEIIEGDKILHVKEIPQTNDGNTLLDGMLDDINPRLSIDA